MVWKGISLTVRTNLVVLYHSHHMYIGPNLLLMQDKARPHNVLA